jgi:hypothetical protein
MIPMKIPQATHPPTATIENNHFGKTGSLKPVMIDLLADGTKLAFGSKLVINRTVDFSSALY